jgi:hypothetical protein
MELVLTEETTSTLEEKLKNHEIDVALLYAGIIALGFTMNKSNPLSKYILFRTLQVLIFAKKR